MKKLQLSFGNYYYDKLMKPIRKQKDCIALILDILNILLVGEEISDERGMIMIVVDKMSRIFCFSGKKYFSMVFPFDMERIEEEGNNYRIYDLALNMEIDNRLIVLMERILNQIDFEESTIDEIIEKAYFDVAEEGYSEDEVGNCFNLVMRLLSMELGYIRYDDDPEHANGALHPLYHLDVNYSSKGTYKLGVNREMGEEDFIDLLNVKTDCKYIM